MKKKAKKKRKNRLRRLIKRNEIDILLNSKAMIIIIALLYVLVSPESKEDTFCAIAISLMIQSQ